MSNYREPSPSRSRVPGRGRVLLSRALPAFLLVFALAACSRAGFIETSEDFLRVAPVAYDTGMTFAKENRAKLSRETLVAFETIRVQFPPAYRAFDSALATYIKADPANRDEATVSALQAEVNRLLGQLQLLVVLNNGPDLGIGRKP